MARRTVDHTPRPPPPRRAKQVVDPRDVALGVMVTGARAGVFAARLALLPARVALRTPGLRGAAERLAFEGRATRRRLEAAGDELLASPEIDALARSLAEHRVVERVARPMLAATDVEAAFAEALENEKTHRLVGQALESELTERVLRSPELEHVVEEVASSAAVRAAVANQTVSFAGEIAGSLRARAEALDDRTSRRSAARVPYAGLVTRGIALALDIGIAHLAVIAGGALVGLIASLVGGDLRPDWLVATLVSFAWALTVGCYFVLFWTVLGQTPGMRVMQLRVAKHEGGLPGLGRSLVRLIGLLLAIVPLFAGFLPVLFDDRRRALQDFLAGTVVLYAEDPLTRTG
jgi:uncharacterized RDD family membrane protein YckC